MVIINSRKCSATTNGTQIIPSFINDKRFACSRKSTYNSLPGICSNAIEINFDEAFNDIVIGFKKRYNIETIFKKTKADLHRYIEKVKSLPVFSANQVYCQRCSEPTEHLIDAQEIYNRTRFSNNFVDKVNLSSFCSSKKTTIEMNPPSSHISLMCDKCSQRYIIRRKQYNVDTNAIKHWEQDVRQNGQELRNENMFSHKSYYTNNIVNVENRNAMENLKSNHICCRRKRKPQNYGYPNVKIDQNLMKETVMKFQETNRPGNNYPMCLCCERSQGIKKKLFHCFCRKKPKSQFCQNCMNSLYITHTASWPKPGIPSAQQAIPESPKQVHRSISRDLLSTSNCSCNYEQDKKTIHRTARSSIEYLSCKIESLAQNEDCCCCCPCRLETKDVICQTCSTPPQKKIYNQLETMETHKTRCCKCCRKNCDKCFRAIGKTKDDLPAPIVNAKMITSTNPCTKNYKNSSTQYEKDMSPHYQENKNTNCCTLCSENKQCDSPRSVYFRQIKTSPLFLDPIFSSPVTGKKYNLSSKIPQMHDESCKLTSNLLNAAKDSDLVNMKIINLRDTYSQMPSIADFNIDNLQINKEKILKTIPLQEPSMEELIDLSSISQLPQSSTQKGVHFSVNETIPSFKRMTSFLHKSPLDKLEKIIHNMDSTNAENADKLIREKVCSRLGNLVSTTLQGINIDSGLSNLKAKEVTGNDKESLIGASKIVTNVLENLNLKTNLHSDDFCNINSISTTADVSVITQHTPSAYISQYETKTTIPQSSTLIDTGYDGKSIFNQNIENKLITSKLERYESNISDSVKLTEILNQTGKANELLGNIASYINDKHSNESCSTSAIDLSSINTTENELLSKQSDDLRPLPTIHRKQKSFSDMFRRRKSCNSLKKVFKYGGKQINERTSGDVRCCIPVKKDGK